jgi:hypothetical protein
MASIWKLNGIDIYVDQYGIAESPTIAEINPINSTDTIFHYINTPDSKVEIQGIVVGSGNLALIRGTVASVVTLITDLDNVTVLVSDIKAERQLIVCQHIDELQSTTAPIYRVTIALRQ